MTVNGRGQWLSRVGSISKHLMMEQHKTKTIIALLHQQGCEWKLFVSRMKWARCYADQISIRFAVSSCRENTERTLRVLPTTFQKKKTTIINATTASATITNHRAMLNLKTPKNPTYGLSKNDRSLEKKLVTQSDSQCGCGLMRCDTQTARSLSQALRTHITHTNSHLILIWILPTAAKQY